MFIFATCATVALMEQVKVDGHSMGAGKGTNINCFSQVSQYGVTCRQWHSIIIKSCACCHWSSLGAVCVFCGWFYISKDTLPEHEKNCTSLGRLSLGFRGMDNFVKAVDFDWHLWELVLVSTTLTRDILFNRGVVVKSWNRDKVATDMVEIRIMVWLSLKV